VCVCVCVCMCACVLQGLFFRLARSFVLVNSQTRRAQKIHQKKVIYLSDLLD
jgi:hypothetical protein